MINQQRQQPHNGSNISVASLWFGLLGGPVAWALRLIISYALVPVVCVESWVWGLHLPSALFLAAALIATSVAWRNRRTLRDANQETADAWGLQRARFMTRLGLWVGSLFTFVILVEWATTFFIGPCVVR